MNLSTAPKPAERLGIYLNDHRALIAGELALADRSRSAHEGTDLAHQLTIHIGAVTIDRKIVDRVLAELGHGVDHLKVFAATAGERLGRLKLNGQLTGQSPLSLVVELEGLIAATHSRHVMWNALDEHDSLDGSDTDHTAAERATIAAKQLAVLRAHLHRAIGDALVTSDGSRR